MAGTIFLLFVPPRFSTSVSFMGTKHSTPRQSRNSFALISRRYGALMANQTGVLSLSIVNVACFCWVMGIPLAPRRLRNALSFKFLGFYKCGFVKNRKEKGKRCQAWNRLPSLQIYQEML
jgi:hypothetical protein